MRLFSKILLLGLSLTLFGGFLHAKEVSVEDYIVGYEDKFIPNNTGPGAKIMSFDDDGNVIEENIYEIPTVKALSLLYWAVDLYKLEDDRAIDIFVYTNECEIYKRFKNDELEWSNVREATKDYLKANKNDFPTRFEFLIPLRLENYDEIKRVFNVQEDFKISSVRRFEVFASDFRNILCTDALKNSQIYPQAVILEFSRPLSIVSVPVSADIAKVYIKRKLQNAINASYSGTPSALLVAEHRTAFLLLKVKIFTHGDFVETNNYHLRGVQMLAVLEGYDIYEDASKERLLYSRDFVSNSKKLSLNVGLKEQIEVLKTKAEGKGILH